ncbi:PREDICTED: RNA polymerase II elongation factor Ell isoform X2 [Dinoponera quadriceps]|uniref:RNA polymerase II elongation factor Ell isoform X2 n=1 Tax=Dinoponera quadriceps TaxID=609295 RepID=A0A6P3XCD7_DINQU|nr:PREDICTED: RNA polymerase II elongation factor Ell isoform X2 [Dinoponera quadriceps]
MATLEAGVQYGLRSNFNENKNLLFVKLTDSAHRQILSYVKNRYTIDKKPTIQVTGNEGRLCFPSLDGHESSFTFSLSGNQDIEGPSGGFECIQQTGAKNLESLGNIPYKMRIHANDDVYETTRHRMVIAEENNKNKCTRVIKANGPNIGRKVKVPVTGRTIPPPSNARHRESSSPASQPKRSPSYRPTTNNLPEKKISDLMRRPLKERLIHLLALRPFKRPELYDRINKEGMREREKPIVTTLLRQVACMRDNSYHLHRHIWNDVQEDWPFYTEQERAILRRRKPQNLTPPGSSDGSTGSGQSPNSIQPGSPPAITAPPPSLLGNKRPGYYQGNDGLQTKKPRISHYRKSETNSSSNASGESGRRTTASSDGGSGVSPTAGGVVLGGGSSNNSANGSAGGSSWDHKRQQQRERRGDCRPERTANSDVPRGGIGYSSGGGRSCQASPSDNGQGVGYGRGGDSAVATAGGGSLGALPSDSHNSHSSPAYSSSLGGGNSAVIVGGDRHYYSGRSSATAVSGGDNSACGGAGVDSAARFAPSGARSDNVNVNNITGNRHGGSPSSGVSADRRDRSDRSRTVVKEDNKDCWPWTMGGGDSANGITANAFSVHADISSGSAHCDLPIIEDSSASPGALEGNLQAATDPLALGSPMTLDSSQLPNYLTYYTTITNLEQRRRYKVAFNAHYEEYRRLHALVVAVSQRFSQLYERMTEQANLGNSSECQRLKQQILMEYQEKRNDIAHIEVRRRFNYLHLKLTHIKQLVNDYDAQNFSENAETTPNVCSNESKDFDSRHY